jgi:signal transduction histidine kinase/CheY-like chemotaxis protein
MAQGTLGFSTSRQPGKGDPETLGRSTRLYAIYGALFGACFPVFSTLMYAGVELGGVGFANLVQAQRVSSLLWIIDTAPLFLGLFASFAGRRQDAVEQLVVRLEAKNAEVARAGKELEKANARLEEANATLASTNLALETTNEQLGASNKALIETSRLKSQFLANMSHELRTPLNAIIGFSRIVLRKTEALIPEKQAKNLLMVHESGKHLLDMVNDLLDIERIEAGMLRVSLSTVAVTNMISDVVAGLSPAAAEKGIVLESAVGSVAMRLRSDPVRLRQVLDNLVNNAIKYSDTGTVRVSLAKYPPEAPTELRLAIEDQGLGIPAEHVAKIFDAFHQVDGSSTRAQGGVGLGLHLVRRLVELLGATVSVASEIGKGSTFTVAFPLSLLVGDEGERAAPAPLEAEGEGPLLLIIDDQPAALDILRTELVEAGFRVESALSGEEGLVKAAAHKPVAILLDMVMPNMDGWAVLKKLRADPDLSSTPVFVTSMLDDSPRAWDLGVVGWLTKPVAPEHFSSLFSRIGVSATTDVLVVEDNLPTQTMVVDHLVDLGFRPRAASDGKQAIEAIDERLPQAMILDLMLPHHDGFQVLEHLRGRPGGGDVPVIVYTAMDLTPEERARLSGGVVEVLTKASSDAHKVITCVTRALARSAAPTRDQP